MAAFSKIFIIIGAVFIVLGILFGLSPKISWLGRLPGDILLQKKNFTFYFPITTSIIFSLILTIIFSIFKGK